MSDIEMVRKALEYQDLEFEEYSAGFAALDRIEVRLEELIRTRAEADARCLTLEAERDAARKTAAKAMKDTRRALAEREELIRTRAEADARCLTLLNELDDVRTEMHHRLMANADERDRLREALVRIEGEAAASWIADIAAAALTSSTQEET